MLAVLQFIFQDFWHWLGFLILLSVALSIPCFWVAAAVEAYAKARYGDH